MKKSEWGPCVWKVLHTLTIKIKDESFESQRKQLDFQSSTGRPNIDRVALVWTFLQKTMVRAVHIGAFLQVYGGPYGP